MAANEKADIRPADLAIRVTTPWASGSTALEYTLDSPVSGLQLHQLAIRGPRLLSSPEEFQQRLLNELESLRKRRPDGQRLSSSEVADEAAGIGQNLFRALFAGEMERIYRQLPREVETLLITSDEPWIPWELLHDGDEFLCLRFRVGRWLAGRRAPTTTLAIRNLLGLRVPTAKSQWNELEILHRLEGSCEGLVGSYEEVVSFQRLREHLRATAFDLFHFSGHGEHALEESLEPRIYAEDRPFRPRNVSPAIQSKLRLRPAFIFLNSCQVGRVGTALTGLEGWAPTWIDCGCAGFLAPSWSVSAASANIFCRAFYGGLAQGLDLGTAVQGARLQLRRRHPGDLAWLAYVLYGTPQARLFFGASRRSSAGLSLPVNAALRRVEHDWGTELGPDLGRAGNWSGTNRQRWRIAIAGFAVFLVVVIALVFRSQQLGTSQLSEVTKRAADSVEETSLTTEQRPEPPAEPSAGRDKQVDQPNETSGEERPSTVVVMPRVAGRVAILATRELDPAIVTALQASLRQIDGVEPLAVAGLHDPAKGGDWVGAEVPAGSGPWGAQYWLYVEAEARPIDSPISSMRSVALSLDAVLVDPSDSTILARSSATHTGIGSTTDAALLQAVTRCLQEITNTLKDRSTS